MRIRLPWRQPPPSTVQDELRRINVRLDAISCQLRRSGQNEEQIMSDLDGVNASLDTLTTTVGDASNQLSELAQAVRDGVDGEDTDALIAVADRIDALSAGLTDVLASTDVVSPPTTEPTPPAEPV